MNRNLRSLLILPMLFTAFHSSQAQNVNVFKVDTLFPMKMEKMTINKENLEENIYLQKQPYIIEYRLDSTLNGSLNDCFAGMNVRSNKKLNRILDTIDITKRYYVNGCLLTSVSSKHKTVRLIDTRKTAIGLLKGISKKDLIVIPLFTKKESQSPNGFVSKSINYQSIELLSNGKDSLLQFDISRSSGYSDDLRQSSSTTTSKYFFDIKRNLVFSIPYYSVSSFRSFCRSSDGRSTFETSKISTDITRLRITLTDEKKGEIQFEYKQGYWVKMKKTVD